MREVNNGSSHSLARYARHREAERSRAIRGIWYVVRGMRYAVRVCGDVALLPSRCLLSLCLGGPGNEEDLEDRWEKKRRGGTYTGEGGSGSSEDCTQQRHTRRAETRGQKEH